MKFKEMLWLYILSFLLHVTKLTSLPIFADEAIYIRWAQLIISEPSRFLFFSMLDGKPPLFMWVLSLFLRFNVDPLWIARLVSVLIGLATLWIVSRLSIEFRLSRRAQLVTNLSVVILPFWFLLHRMALMDGLLALLLGSSFLWASKLARVVVGGDRKQKIIKYVLLLALSFTLALYTKTPALFFIPVIALVPVYFWWGTARRDCAMLIKALLWVGIAGFFGCLMFLGLALTPYFGSLFSRSSDFTFTIPELINGEWKYVLVSSLPRIIGWIITYSTWPVILIIGLGLLIRSGKQLKNLIFFLVCGAFFAVPLIALGRVLWPRYYLPVMIFISLALGSALDNLLTQSKLRMIAALLLIICAFLSLRTMATSYWWVEMIPFVAADRVEYLEEWSAGFGNREIADFISKRRDQFESDDKKVILLTEGSFGTLPDGVMVYIFGHGKEKNLEIHGLGLGLEEIPTEFITSLDKNEIYYAVNSHRIKLRSMTNVKLIRTFNRPNQAPSLLLFQVIK